MMRFLVKLFAVVGVIAVLLFAGAIGAVIAFSPGAPTVPSATVLTFDFERPVRERPATDPIAGLLGDSQPTVFDVVRAIDRAAKDERVKGLVARVGNTTLGPAGTQEVRDAVARFRAGGKFAVIHAEDFGEGGGGMGAYHLASSFEEIWMLPVGMLGVQGYVADIPTFRGTLEKLMIEPQFDKRTDYKTAAEQFMEREPTPANREVTTSLLTDLFDQWVAHVAAARGLTEAQVRAAVDTAPLLDREAVEAKLIDRLGSYEELWAQALSRAGIDPKGDAELGGDLDLLTYAGIAGDPAPLAAPSVAVVIGSGMITRGGSDPSPFGGESFGPSDIAAAIDKAAEDPRIRAILFRVDSPGGSPVGSEVVRQAVQRAQAAGKPVVVSMADVAGSGGYWVAMDADRIVAQPGTLTGSIGVVYGKLVTRGLMEWAGVGSARIQVGANAGIWSANTPFSDGERARMTAILDDTYARFMQGVATGRDLEPAVVERIAKGRVYTGRQALEFGLVDALGGYDVAMDQVRELIGVAPGSPLRTIVFPEPKSQIDYLMELAGGDAGVAVRQAVLGDALAEAEPAVRALLPWLTATSPEEMIVMMPPMVLSPLP